LASDLEGKKHYYWLKILKEIPEEIELSVLVSLKGKNPVFNLKNKADESF